MTALQRTPQNPNYLQASKYLLTFNRIGSVQYFCQSVNIPGVNLGQAPINTPMLDIFAPGNKMTYNPLAINFNLDEGLDSWQQLHAWFRSIASPQSFDERNRLTSIQNVQRGKTKTLESYSDATLTLLSALNNPILKVHFYNVFPITLSDVEFDVTQSADNIVTASAVFIFDYFDFETV
jgi:hypothetical protein